MKQTDDHHVAALDRLADQLRVVMRLGEMLLSAGASAFRVKDGMDRIAHAVGIDKISIQVTYTEITATAFAGGTFRTELVEQRVMGINAERIDDLNDFVHNLPGKMLVEDADDMLDAFANKDPLYSMPVSALASGVACAGFAFLNQGGWVECLVVFFAALAGQATRKTLLRRHMNHFALWMACGFVATSLYMGIVSVFQIADIVDASHQSGVVSSVLFLVPGFPLVTSILDLIRQDYIAGIARGVYVVMLLISTAASVWAVTGLLNWNVNPSADGYHLNTWLLLLGRILASFVAAYGFAMLFNVCLCLVVLAAILAFGRQMMGKLHRSRHRHGHQRSPTHRPGRRARTDVGHRTGGVPSGASRRSGRQVDEVFEGDAFRSGRCRDDPRRPALPRTVSAQ